MFCYSSIVTISEHRRAYDHTAKEVEKFCNDNFADFLAVLQLRPDSTRLNYMGCFEKPST